MIDQFCEPSNLPCKLKIDCSPCDRRRTGFGYVRRVDRQNVHALSVASTASNFIVWAPSGNGKASRTWVGTERVYPIWVGFSFFVKRCTCSILFQETL